MKEFIHRDSAWRPCLAFLRRMLALLAACSIGLMFLLVPGWRSNAATLTFEGTANVGAGHAEAIAELVRSRGLMRSSGADVAVPVLNLTWSSSESDSTVSVAWGDYDGDGDLDLAVGNDFEPNRLYRNDGGILTASAVWSSSEAGDTECVAWGDYDGDGDLDLAVGNTGQPNRLYRNDGGTLTASAAWSSAESDATWSVAWGDYDGDGDLDLAVGNHGQPDRLYRNDGGTLTVSAVWSSAESDATTSVAWGDYDGDGDLDLAVGNEGQPNRLYRNDGGTLSASAIWSSSESENTSSVAWGDYDGDGDPDLVVGNVGRPNRLYRNDGGTLTASAIWSSAESDWTMSVAWGDYDGDGDLDLAVGNLFGSNRLYRNEGGILSVSAVWSSDLSDWTWSVAWGDYDDDGDLDLATGNWSGPNRLYRNDGGTLSDRAVWSSSESDATSSVAWGDYDGDGDLDLAVGNAGQPNHLYRNDGGILSASAVWISDESDDTQSIAWGDYDADGDLDLAVGNDGDPVRLYRNDGGILSSSAIWSSALSERIYSVSWGDYDGDRDLDLAVGTWDGPNRLYRNESGTFTASAIWSSTESDDTWSVAWGDYDGDGDLDLAVGNRGQPNRLYRNDSGILTASAVWSSADSDFTHSVAWGDYDGDGDLDLAVGNESQPNRLYRNDNGELTTSAVWSSSESDWTASVAWGDYDGDGDLDLAVGNQDQPNRLYSNEGGKLAVSAAWSSGDSHYTTSVAWGDYDGDGDLDLAIGNRSQPNLLCPNVRNARMPLGLPGGSARPAVRLVRPTPPGNAAFYSAPNTWPALGGTIAISYTLSQPESRPVRYIRAFYSSDGGGRWLPAVAASGTITTNLATSFRGVSYIYNWDVFASSFFDRSDNVTFRIVAIPDLQSAANSVPGPYLYGSNASDTYPFRVRGTQVRVLRDGAAVQGAYVFRQAAGQSQAAEPMVDRAGQPFVTDSQGYLQGRGEIGVGDRLFALAPITATETYALYHTNATPTATGLDAYTVTRAGVQMLTVSSAHPLVLFNLDVALEWDARRDQQFMSQLRYDLQRASEVLFDWTNGQAALGRVRIYHDAKRQPEVDGWQPWLDAHVRIYASNRLRPNASQGGIVSQIVTETVPSAVSTVITYTPGQVHIGPVWNRYGDSNGSLGEDWPRTLAHELGHFALYQEDNYLGLDAGGLLKPVEGCPSAMSDPYRDDWSEFHGDTAWTTECNGTLSQQLLGRSDWATIKAHYPWLNAAPENPGPSGLPLAVTEIEIVEPANASTALPVPIFYLTQGGRRVQPGQSARAFLFRGDWAADLGRPTLDQVTARGAAVGDHVCVYELAAGRFGCETVTPGDELLALVAAPDWQPSVTVTPVTTRTISINVSNLPAGFSLGARLYPVNAPAGAAIALSAMTDSYTGTFNLDEPALEGYVRVWVNEPEPRREVVVDYALSGSPGYRRSEGGYRRSDGGYRRSEGAPVMSPDGQVILFINEESTASDSFYTLQALPAPPQPPLWATVVGQAYRLSASPNVPTLSGASLSVSYLGNEVPPGEEQWLRLYFWDGAAWKLLDTRLDTYHNLASAAVQGPGVYALMSALEIPLYGPGWNLFAYPVQGTRPVTEALISITGYYTTVYGYEPVDPVTPWRIYDVTVPDWVNDLRLLQFGRGYWIHMTQAVTLRLRGATVAQASQTTDMLSPPATFYGAVLPRPGFTPAAGLQVKARIGDAVCGQAVTREISRQIVYAVKVAADGSGSAIGCGAAGSAVRFEVDRRLMAPIVVWDNNRVQEVPLSPQEEQRIYMPLLLREP